MPESTLSQPYLLDATTKEAYRRDGFILVKDIVDHKTLQPYRRTILDVVDRVTREKNPQGRISDYSAMFTQVTNVWTMDKKVEEFVHAPRFAQIAAELMGVSGVRLYHDQALIKEPGGKATPWHQDQYYWPLDTEHTITMWMPLVDVTPQMGSMSFVPGSHKKASFQRMAISDTSQAYFEKYISESGSDTPSFSLNAGDATFHAGWTLHAAHANQSNHRREVITVIFYAEGTRILQPENEHQKVDMEVFHPGCKPGAPAASPLNPLLYTAPPEER